MKRPVDFLQMKEAQEKITMLTAYDYPSAKNAEKVGVDMILVGDSLGMVVLGYDSTIPVTIADMIHHTKAVRRGAPDTFIVTDMPFLSYHGSTEETIRNARQIIQETGANALKLEGAGDVFTKITHLSAGGVAVVAHLGLTPQTVGLTGSYKVQAKTKEAAQGLLRQAKEAEAAGAIALVLEAIPRQLAKEVTAAISIPTIGIGAGVDTDGQVLVYHDVIQYGTDRVAKFVKTYADVDAMIDTALTSYVSDVKSGSFPALEHTFTMSEETLKGLYGGQ
ncbi:3-methyl-2-oxobutanoate hydroxymethyltransferase [Listeria newyorkensis]|uniref:3-methyl-2-oxobutanoate hydroxymethyltransferase n=1 Tax=Listeria newyorkensis TaxID=1497681 RepID=A0ABX4XN04_9LIST|nr:3-methyl-2-oxobutanoate hydroxymethyltransferase [Listeria newyorkensis]KGL41020.1 3-methyl-2-oxobutanoate hydroxymethyltransferase [Listeria newyorkensis]KMT57800.1 3-methyl-2-oxobutanoate hydroxymethyltransferase [Listeria newyorkensis]PNP92496.1 3-methyl-2-oxobutanoate hydroxymethyltransferase [Listeria newyorkensis]WAO21447.1 3-methyl-2-oxobutanoate hydroxymethyltransferase [Listeria newyorkensis]SQC56794.1 3-methyl-2-oxobutanoate hydroxymethyltransferase [Listeria newyorkensis]